jgi:vitamin B12 transporter
MKSMSIAGLAGFAALGAYAQVPDLSFTDPILVTAARLQQPATTLRDATVITRADIEAAGALSLGELLERRAGVELRATGGPGQPQTLFMRGAGSAQTLVLVDGLRVGSATIGTTSIENIPLEMIERIEVVKGPLSSLYGADAIGGVVQIFTRGGDVPHLFGTVAYGTDRDERVSAGVATSDEKNKLALNIGARRVDAPSATNSKSFCFDPDRDPYENAFVNLHGSHQLWQGEVLALDAFATYGKTHFDGTCDPTVHFDDINRQTISGVKLSSSTHFTDFWASRLVLGDGRDRITTSGAFPGVFETEQQQGTWINEFKTSVGSVLAGYERTRQRIRTDESQGVFARTARDTNSVFAGVNENRAGQRFEASVRRDDDDSFGRNTTGSASYGLDWPPFARLSATYGKGFRAPTFFDLFGPTSSFYHPKPDLRPERSVSREVSIRSLAPSPIQWRLTAFDNRIDDLIAFVSQTSTVANVSRARIRGIEAEASGAWRDFRWHAAFTAQRPRDEDTGTRLQGRARHFGTVDLSRTYKQVTGTLAVHASGDRFDSFGEAPGTRLPGYAVIDARVRYRFQKFWSVELAVTNLADKRYESVQGFDAPRRAALLSVRFDAF